MGQFFEAVRSTWIYLKPSREPDTFEVVLLEHMFRFYD